MASPASHAPLACRSSNRSLWPFKRKWSRKQSGEQHGTVAVVVFVVAIFGNDLIQLLASQVVAVIVLDKGASVLVYLVVVLRMLGVCLLLVVLMLLPLFFLPLM